MDISDSDFEKEVIEKSMEIPVIVDFWAPWCGPCRMLGPVLEKVSQEYEGKVVLAKVNVDDYKEKAQEFGVMGIPSVKLFKNGKLVDEFTGVIPESMVEEWIEKNI